MSDEFFDAVSDIKELEILQHDQRVKENKGPDVLAIRRNIHHMKCSSDIAGRKSLSGRSYRRKIPDRPAIRLNLWSFIKNAIGKDLTKIPMPVNFNEPLSMLQRLAESLQYSSLIDKASKSDDTLLQLAYVSGFAVSCYSETANRVNKPFNPLLNETYEFDRSTDLGWRCICEQVSHHPPVSALYAESKSWKYSETFAVASKFRGKYLLVEPLGACELIFADGNRYSWNKVETTVNNIIIGTLSIEQTGTMVVVNHVTGENCNMKFHSSSIFSSKSRRKITGIIENANGDPKFTVEGFWDKFVEFLKITKVLEKDTYETNFPSRLWSAILPMEESSKYYNFTEFACSLNQEQENVAPTDSRLRPDQRALENGDCELADTLKVKLEENQRARRKAFLQTQRDKDPDFKNDHEELIKPVWFEVDKNNDIQCGAPVYKYKGGYWESKLKGNWAACPSLYDV